MAVSTVTTAGATGSTTTGVLPGVHDLAGRLVPPGRGILAADESVGTMNARLTSAGVEPTQENRRAYREMLLTTPGLSDAVSGVILNPETLGQTTSDGEPFALRLAKDGVLAGVKVDTGTEPLPRTAGETVTAGLDGLADRLQEYAAAGAVFAKWRAVLRIGPRRPSSRAVVANAHALARYAAACQAAGIVPIVEPEVVMDGDHGIARCALVTSSVLREVFGQLVGAGVDLSAVVLKPNLVAAGAGAPSSSPEEVALATTEVLLATVPDAVPGIAFLSGGIAPELATRYLAALRPASRSWPWTLTFSFGRALVDPALAAWAGDPGRVDAGQRALAARVRANAEALAAQ